VGNLFLFNPTVQDPAYKLNCKTTSPKTLPFSLRENPFSISGNRALPPHARISRHLNNQKAQHNPRVTLLHPSVQIRANPWATSSSSIPPCQSAFNKRAPRSSSSINKLAVDFHRQSLSKSTAAVKIRANPWAKLFNLQIINFLSPPSTSQITSSKTTSPEFPPSRTPENT